MSDLNAVCLIPARGGSKRIPRKNVRAFHGKPLIAWPVEAAVASGLFADVIVSTDDDGIAEVALDSGASVPFRRPSRFADDHASTDDVIGHALDWLEARGRGPRLLCCVYPTAPFITPDVLRGARDVLIAAGARGSVTTTTFDYPVWRALRRTDEGHIAFQWEEHRNRRSQDLPELIHDAGQCYWIDVAKYRAHPRLLGEGTVAYPVPRWEAQDIDTEEDWHVAEKLFAIRRMEGD